MTTKSVQGGVNWTVTVLSRCRETLLEYFLGLDMEDTEVIELKQETTSLRRSDLPLKVISKTHGTFIVLLEIQSRWEKEVPLRLLEYEVRFRIDTGLDVIPVVLVLTKSSGVVDFYQDRNTQYRFKVLKLWELDPEEVFQNRYVCLAPFTVLMKRGKELYEKADKLILESELEQNEKGSLLTAMALLSGLVDKDMPKFLFERRRDIMKSSYAYDMIKKEGLEEGILQGLERGMIEEAKALVLEGLAERFKMVPKDLEEAIKGIESRTVLKELHRAIFRARNIQGFRKFLNEILVKT